jgi:peptidoglycan/xylan/chitin deacetylase (PgdA/CDA1 family)
MQRLTNAVMAIFAVICFAPPAMAAPCPGNPEALGVSRTVEIDTSGGPGFGLAQYKIHDFLQPGEVVLTFDDGPWPNTTDAVLEALEQHCTKATFFIIGKHAVWHPDILKRVAAAGHTIGTHTWSHANLAKKKMKGDAGKAEIEKGFSAVRVALGAPPSPFFRFPFLQDPKETIAYLGERNIAIFSMDLDSVDFRHRKAEAVTKSVLDKLAKQGKGIILMHDFQKSTAEAMPELLKQLKEKGYRVVHLTAKAPVATLPQYDTEMAKQFAGPMENARPTSSVVRTITGN